MRKSSGAVIRRKYRIYEAKDFRHASCKREGAASLALTAGWAHRTGLASRPKLRLRDPLLACPYTPGNGCVPASVNLPGHASESECRVAPVICFRRRLFAVQVKTSTETPEAPRPAPGPLPAFAQKMSKNTKFLDNYALEQSNWKSGKRDHHSPIPRPVAVLTAVLFQRLVLVCAAQDGERSSRAPQTARNLSPTCALIIIHGSFSN